jgi:hypothetical protein
MFVHQKFTAFIYMRLLNFFLKAATLPADISFVAENRLTAIWTRSPKKQDKGYVNSHQHKLRSLPGCLQP